ncbi:hypothetical protein M6B38_315420 [Iris pallida]|uniref:Secreted protein n=1 Tax=Iris pallida TaxID=29817 RepID=A0AAX6HF92_IRIPA|nr:hypothetical protein M6B38_315420 [Iris pallida]
MLSLLHLGQSWGRVVGAEVLFVSSSCCIRYQSCPGVEFMTRCIHLILVCSLRGVRSSVVSCGLVSVRGTSSSRLIKK